MNTTQTMTQQRVALVLARLAALSQDDEDNAEMLAAFLEDMLDDIVGHDGFGTEQQCDPRGDGRNGAWSMDHVEGIDG